MAFDRDCKVPAGFRGIPYKSSPINWPADLPKRGALVRHPKRESRGTSALVAEGDPTRVICVTDVEGQGGASGTIAVLADGTWEHVWDLHVVTEAGEEG